MKNESIVTRSLGERRKGKTDWARVRALTDAEILAAVKNDPNSELLDDEFWATAVKVNLQPKIPTSLRIDPDVLTFFKSEGRGYQTRINAVLRTYMNHYAKVANTPRRAKKESTTGKAARA
jgi:uncharacterized protein (DUF4415 family)